MMSGTQEPIAIIGTGCRFPGEVSSASQLWELLREPRDVSQDIPPDRFNIARFYHPDGAHHGTTNVRRSYFLSQDVRCFDTQFFGIPPAEAEPMDPQHRVLLEVVYEAIQSAGLTLEGLHDSDTAAYVGLMCSDYYVLQAQDFNTIPTYNVTGIANSNASSRISYFFNWHGPSMTIDTACSSSLVAVHEAVQALRSGRSQLAVAAGTNLLLSPLPYISESKLNMLSPTGRSRMWDADADGYARGEGVAAVILKPLCAALRDGDPIMSIIRETGINQDGRTKGITMPSAQAQACLIADTYARAGLDPTKECDRCQYFEAHGTGTPAGDPQEAEALSRAFFPGPRPGSEILYAGSVKTVIGHTEGTAGIAGLIKASMALKHGLIPPNLHFNRLNPTLEPFTSHLGVPTALLPWPSLPAGSPRRASVNSFGFGGTNAHAILESYSTPPGTQSEDEPPNRPVLPFVFSATSQKSLLAVLQSHIAYLQEREDVNLRDLAHTLAIKRSALPVKVAIPASSHRELCDRLHKQTQEATSADDVSLGTQSSLISPSVLAIFTGQGAQWAAMGIRLIEHCPKAREMMEVLDRSLAALPENLRPRWTLMRELMADHRSRIGEAEISQPLCTAIQIVLVDILRFVGVTLTAVVGHSSGEIATAYAAGFISASDAIRIAFLRGLVAKMAYGEDGKHGAMMAVGTSFADAMELCELEEFKGRLCVAAHNSPESVTLSGDLDSIHQAKVVFEEEKKFVRILQVDTAYHSHHMAPSTATYLKMLRECKIKVERPPSGAPAWYSTVSAGAIVDVSAQLDGQYWVDNMQQTVRFESGLQACIQDTSRHKINFLLEIGPHPALRGPTRDSIRSFIDSPLPYACTLNRRVHDHEALAGALGSLWTTFGKHAVDFSRLEQAFYGELKLPRALSDLPAYPWNHDRVLWAESRSARLLRTQGGSFHDLLGTRTSDGNAQEWRWRNVLKTQELQWLSGHALQGQTVFPGTGYIALAMEASLQIAGERPVTVIELCDLRIMKAIAINDSVGTETLVTMTEVSTATEGEGEVITANFTTFSTVGKESDAMGTNTSGRVRITIGGDVADTFPPRTPPMVNLASVDIDRFYSAMRDDLGYQYEGPFRGLTSLQRRLGQSSGTITNAVPENPEAQLLFHPGMLDNALQGLFAAYSAPGDGRLWSMRAPTACRRVTLIPSLCGRQMTPELAFDCTVTDPRDDFITGDVDVYVSEYAKKIIEFEGLSFSPFAAATEKDDRCLFQESVYLVNQPDGALALGDRSPTADERQKALDAERAAFFYLKELHQTMDHETRQNLPWYRQALLDNTDRVVALVGEGAHPYAPLSWLEDTREEIYAMMSSYGDRDADFNLTRAVGENLPRPSVLQGEVNILEYMTENNYLDDYYKHAIGFGWLNDLIASTITQITNKYPNMHICEIGAGTGGATGAILERIGSGFSSYTYTDISSGFFEKAERRFHAYDGRMGYKVLNIEQDPVEQGFQPHSYDLVLAANVLHATKSLEETLRNTRRLLKPGGFLVLMEIVGNDVFRVGLVMGGLPGWWVGKDDGRRYAPTIELEEWDTLMRRTGFSGVDTFTPMPDKVQMPGSVFVTQAIDSDISRLREPFEFPLRDIPSHTLLIIGGTGQVTSVLADDLTRRLQPYFTNVIAIRDLHDLPLLVPDTVALSLIECDRPLFENISKAVWDRFKTLVTSLTALLWVTSGSEMEKPHAAITVGLLRSLFYEAPETKLQLLDVANIKQIAPQLLGEMLLRLELCATVGAEKQDHCAWTVEPELFLRDSRLYTARVRPQIDQNDRYNAFRRSIIQHKNIQDAATLILGWQEDGCVLRENHDHAPKLDKGSVTIKVECSLLSAIKTPCGFRFIALGVDQESKEKRLCFSTVNASVITVLRELTVVVSDDQIIDAQYMSFVVAALISSQVIGMIPHSGTLLLHEPDPGLASLVTNQVSNTGGKVAITTTQLQNKERKNWVYFHERSTMRVIQKAIPGDITMVIDFTATSQSNEGVAARIVSSVGHPCEKVTLSHLISREPSFVPDSVLEPGTSFLSQADAFASSQLNAVPDGAPLAICSLAEATSDTLPVNPLTLVRWLDDDSVPVLLQPVTTRGDLFREDRAYWLAGLTGDLGQSIADFMIERGARYIALSSRQPKVCDRWVAYCKSKGAKISVFACDLVDPISVQSVHGQITETMAPLGGVANGALLLRDIPLSKMSLEAYETVTKPKVNGTMNLDQVCRNDDLDWFIAFSSIVATTGNLGQAAYSAANCFMKALVKNRRSRGLTGSVIDVSRVIGVGYVERETQASGRLTKEQTERLRHRTGTLPMSEPDLHQLFAEAIVAGRPGSAHSPEIITGLSPISAEEAKGVFWAQNPKFGLLIHEQGALSANHVNATVARIPVKAQLREATSVKEASGVILGALLEKLKTSLFLSDGEGLSPETPLVDLGVDSLVGVDVRSWLLKELSVDIPVLKILGGSATSDIVVDIMEKLPRDLIQPANNPDPVAV